MREIFMYVVVIVITHPERRFPISQLTIAPYFPFRRLKLLQQRIVEEEWTTHISAVPNMRYRPVCHKCATLGTAIHDWEERIVRDLSLSDKRVFLHCRYRKIFCPTCKSVRIKDLECFAPYSRVTRRLAQYIHDLCSVMTVQEVANHLKLDWKTVKEIDKAFLEKEYGTPKLDGLRVLAVDEIAIKKRHRYMTVVLDYETGRVVWMKEDRTCETLCEFFSLMSEEQRKRLEAIAMDMWDPYIKAVQESVPHVKIVFDLYHVVAAFGRVIDTVRNLEYHKASKANKSVIKGTKYLLLMNKRRIRTRKARQHLNRLLKLNGRLAKLYILKDRLKWLWDYSSQSWSQKALESWCSLARTIRYPVVRTFAERLERYSYGILNHCLYPINSAKLEGTNNKIKVIKRKAYGFHDTKYFTLKVIQAFDPLNGR